MTKVGKNVSYALDKNILTIVVDTSVLGEASKSGKSTLIATTRGGVSVEGADVTLSLNVYRPV